MNHSHTRFCRQFCTCALPQTVQLHAVHLRPWVTSSLAFYVLLVLLVSLVELYWSSSCCCSHVGHRQGHNTPPTPCVIECFQCPAFSSIKSLLNRVFTCSSLSKSAVSSFCSKNGCGHNADCMGCFLVASTTSPWPYTALHHRGACQTDPSWRCVTCVVTSHGFIKETSKVNASTPTTSPHHTTSYSRTTQHQDPLVAVAHPQQATQHVLQTLPTLLHAQWVGEQPL